MFSKKRGHQPTKSFHTYNQWDKMREGAVCASHHFFLVMFESLPAGATAGVEEAVAAAAAAFLIEFCL
jgi:hypothetical protein